MTTMIYSPNSVDSNAFHAHADLGGDSVSALPFQTSRRMPQAISAGQAYYWSFIWQRDQQESQNALEQGQGITFDSAQDAIRWLLSADE